ncbi:MAG: Kelch repeat-containing protein [Solirubrobacteraceae bacterium]
MSQSIVPAFATVAAAAIVLAGCGGGATSVTGAARHASDQAGRALTAGPARRPRAREPEPQSVRLRYRQLYSLPAALRDPAFAVIGGGRFVMLGGLNAADESSAGIEVADSRRVLSTGSLPGPQHDAQAAALGQRVYVFGGGYTTELDHILSWDPATGDVARAGTLAAPQSDVAVARAGETAYVVGGFDGTDYLHTIVAWREGAAPRVVARLPVGLRYAAVAVARGGLLVIGGSTPVGASDAIYRFDLATHAVSRIGILPHGTTHGDAATLGGTVYLIGGRGDSLDSQTAEIYAIDPVTGKVRRAGRLPQAISDAAAVTIGDAILVAGGQSPAGVVASVGELSPAPAR